MGRWRWMRRGLLFPTRRLMLGITSRIRHHQTRGRGHDLMKLYKDMESCKGYADIQVMWEMIHSSCPPPTDRKKRWASWSVCFWPS